MSLTELAIATAVKDNHTRASIAQAAVGMIQSERFDVKVALKQLDRLEFLKLIDREGADHYMLSRHGINEVQASIGRVDFIRHAIRQKFFF